MGVVRLRWPVHQGGYRLLRDNSNGEWYLAGGDAPAPMLEDKEGRGSAELFDDNSRDAFRSFMELPSLREMTAQEFAKRAEHGTPTLGSTPDDRKIAMGDAAKSFADCYGLLGVGEVAKVPQEWRFDFDAGTVYRESLADWELTVWRVWDMWGTWENAQSEVTATSSDIAVQEHENRHRKRSTEAWVPAPPQEVEYRFAQALIADANAIMREGVREVCAWDGHRPKLHTVCKDLRTALLMQCIEAMGSRAVEARRCFHYECSRRFLVGVSEHRPDKWCCDEHTIAVGNDRKKLSLRMGKHKMSLEDAAHDLKWPVEYAHELRKKRHKYSKRRSADG